MENIRLNRYFIVTCILLIIVTFAFQSLAAEPRHGGRIVISSGSGVPRHFNQAVVSGSATVMIGAQIFASPLRYDENWTPQPYLAKTWDFSKDNLSLTLNLVKGAFFHDGQPITSADLAFSIMAVKKYHPFKPMFAPVERVDTPDPLTAVIRLSHPHPAILLALSPPFLPILPKHIYGDGQDLATHPANLSPVGSGPFKFQKYVKGKYIVLEKNERFFIPGRPYLDEILNQAAMEMDFTKRKLLYSQFQLILTDELPIVWLNILPYHTIFHKALINPPISIWGIHSPLDELYWEKLPVKKYVSTPLVENAKSSLERVGIRAINLLKAKGLFGALEILVIKETIHGPAQSVD